MKNKSIAIVFAAWLFAGLCSASPLNYTLTSSTFGGSNGYLIGIIQYERILRQDKDAKIRQASAEKMAVDAAVQNSNPANQLATNLVSYLNATLAQRTANAILGGSGNGSIVSGNTTITYVTVDGVIDVTISVGGAITKISLPVSGGIN